MFFSFDFFSPLFYRFELPFSLGTSSFNSHTVIFSKKKGSLFLTLSVTGFTVIFYFCYWPTPHAMFYIFHIHDTEFSVFFCFARFISMLIDGRFVHGLSDHHHYYHRLYILLFLVYVFFSPHSLSLSLSLAIVCLVFLMLHALRSLCMFLCLHFAFTGAHVVRICKSVFFSQLLTLFRSNTLFE